MHGRKGKYQFPSIKLFACMRRKEKKKEGNDLLEALSRMEGVSSIGHVSVSDINVTPTQVLHLIILFPHIITDVDLSVLCLVSVFVSVLHKYSSIAAG